MIIITVQEKEVLLWHATLTRIPHINMKERDTALDILIDYEKNESYLNITLNHTLTKDFSPSERGLIKGSRKNASINESLPTFLSRYTRLCNCQ